MGLSLVVPTEEVSAAECIDPDEEDLVEEEEEEMCSSVTGRSGSCGEEVEEEEEGRDTGFPLLFAIKLSREDMTMGNISCFLMCKKVFDILVN